MRIKIGHASIDEKGKIKGGCAGDQTGKEVCIRTWYSRPWAFVLRCKDPAKAEKMAAACEKGCSNDKIGYDQNQRNTLHTQAKKTGFDLSKITEACETDCSAFMTVCAQAAGIPVPYNGTNAPTTSTMKSAFTKTGEFDVLTDSRYLTSDTCLKRGDILVKPGSHTVMALENGSSASFQTPSAPTSASPSPAYTKTQFIKEVQAATGAKTDGIAGPETLSKTVTVSSEKNSRHAVVKPVQKYLYALGYTSVGTADGIAGSKFTTAVDSYQKTVLNYNHPDGEITARGNMWKSLLGLH